MVRVVVAGLPDIAVWLARRFPGATMLATSTVEETRSALAEGEWTALLIDDRLDGQPGKSLVERLRAHPCYARLPILYCLAQRPAGEQAKRLVADLGVHRLLVQPVDREDIARHIASLARVPLPPTLEASEVDPEERAELIEIWEKYRDQRRERIATLELATLAIRSRTLDASLAMRAEAAAHWLAGSVGTFGYLDGTRIARSLERVFKVLAPSGSADAEQVAELLGALQAELSRPPLAATPSAAPAGSMTEGEDAPYLLIADDDPAVGEALAREAGGRGMRTTVATDIASAREAARRERPSAVVLDLAFPGNTEGGLALLAEMGSIQPPIPVLIHTSSDEFSHRVETARLGAGGFLHKPLSPAAVLTEVQGLLQRVRSAQPHVLAVDDDSGLLAALRARIQAQGVRVTTLDDPLRFWDVLEHASPDLLVLDVEMPHVGGIELCRVVRNDARWSRLPVLFLTTHVEPDVVERLFAAGADDYVTKPIIGAELITRIRNRLDRVRLHRRLAETDFLTGVSNRQRSGETLEKLLRLAERQRAPLSVGLLDLDRFKDVNDTHGHAAGDAVLARLGRLLLRTFRGEDVVARWGGEEFVVGMYGMTRNDGVERLAQALEAWRTEEFAGKEDAKFHCSFSAGISQYPCDGGSLDALYRVADEALYRAKHEGRDRIVPAGPGTEAAGDDGAIAVAVADDATAAMVRRALVTRGYRVWAARDQEAMPRGNGARVAVIGGEGPPDGLDAAAILRIESPVLLADVVRRVRFAMEGDLRRAMAEAP